MSAESRTKKEARRGRRQGKVKVRRGKARQGKARQGEARLISISMVHDLRMT